MATEPKSLEIEEELPPQDEQPPAPAAGPDDEEEPAPDDETGEEEVLTFGDSDEEVQDTDNATIRHLRTRLKDVQKENAELKRHAPAPQATDVGPEPTMESCDWDEGKFKAEWKKWDDRKVAADRAANAQTEAAEAQRKALEGRLTRFTEQKAAIGKDDADDAMETVRAALGEAKFVGIVGLLDDTTDAAKFMYALSNSPANLEALSNQTDGIKLVKQVTKLEGQLKMVKRKAPPAIDAPERGSGKISRETQDKKLQALEKEADRTGDRTKVIAYKREQRKAAQAAAQ